MGGGGEFRGLARVKFEIMRIIIRLMILRMPPFCRHLRKNVSGIPRFLIFVSWSCRIKTPQREWLITAGRELDSVTVPDVTSPKSKCQQGHAPEKFLPCLS